MNEVMTSPTSLNDHPKNGKRWPTLVSLLIPITLVGGFLFLMISLRDGAEAAVAGLAGWLPVGYAFAAGMVASVNPCGFLMLPTYISYHLGTQEEGYYRQPAAKRLSRALALGLVATVGFLVILAFVGTIIAAGGQWLIRAFPYAGVFIGGAMLILGLWLLVTHRTLGVLAATRVTVSPKRNLRNVFLFGIAYATGSLSCTLPIFLVVVGSSLASQGLMNSFVQFIGYGLGMGSILIAVTIGAALFQGTVARWLKAAMPYVHRMSALFLAGAGAYLVYYWLFIAGITF
ncbi:MAG TPA: cytochrome c biogenesis protein CcdA [Anaerolineae bacterium]|nr:cytochrome c biogenesis protein CcdA [Anaerolineae bacterium]